MDVTADPFTDQNNKDLFDHICRLNDVERIVTDLVHVRDTCNPTYSIFGEQLPTVSVEQKLIDLFNQYMERNNLREFLAWLDLIGRHYDPSHSKYSEFGGMWLTVDVVFHDFKYFLQHMGHMPETACGVV